jgi:hypothetical protein
MPGAASDVRPRRTFHAIIDALCQDIAMPVDIRTATLTHELILAA